MIPKVIHRIWLGDKPMPEEYKRYGDTWAQHHPGWEMKLWVDHPVNCAKDTITLPQTKFWALVASCRELRNASNIYRYELLANEGGVYVDCDFECQKNIEPLLEGADFVTAAQLPSHSEVGGMNPAFFATIPFHSVIDELVDGLHDAAYGTDFERSRCGPIYFTAVVLRGMKREASGVRVLPRGLFYPYGWWEMHRANQAFPLAYAIHRWGSRTQPFAGAGIRRPW